MCLLASQLPVGFLMLWVTLGAIQATLFLFFPSRAREIYVWWKGIGGLRVDPTSPMLSDAAFRFFGVLTVGLVILVVLVVEG